MMGCCSWSKRSRRNNPDYVTVDAELRVGIHSVKCAKEIRKEICELDGVEICDTEIYNQKVMVAGTYDLEKVKKILKKKTGQKAEVLRVVKQSEVVLDEDDESDILEKEDDESEIVPEKNEEAEIIPEKNEGSGKVPKKEENSEIKLRN